MKQRKIQADVKKKILFLIVIILFFLLLIYRNTFFLIRTAITILVIIVFYNIDKKFDIKFKPMHYIFMILIMVASLMFNHVFFIYPNYDKLLHLIQPILFSSIIFHILGKLKITLKNKLILTFFIIIAIIGILEIGEYLLDLIFDLKLQGVYLRDAKGIEKFSQLMTRIDDTMVDMILGVIGALIYAILLAIFYKKKN